MKKTSLIIVALTTALAFNTESVSAQFGKKLKDKMGESKGGGKGEGEKAGKFSSFNEEADEMGVTGEYFGLIDKRSFGFRFVKEADGKLVNKLDYFEKKGTTPQLSLSMKESYFQKNKVKLFHAVVSNTYVELLEVDPGVFAQIKSDYNNNGNAVPPDAKRTVVDVYAKEKSKFETWDVETSQAKVEMIMIALNTENLAKIKEKLMNFDSYKKYKGKIAFAKGTNYFRNDRDYEPKEKLEWMITKSELGNTLAFKPYFDQILAVTHPGAWFNITYEMAGEKTDREALRKSSTFFSKNIPLMEKDKDQFYFFYARGPIDNNGSADYAYLELLRKLKDKLKEGQTYDLKVTVWAFKDGENIAPVAEGIVQQEYTKGETGSKKLLSDPVSGWIPKMEKWIDE
ncbi:hypothetical protein [Aurantibacillus circumpalustris]|uniref:hypothetical protein n=1 Tax=Aurantibacillus circumpalustris TaxID=3036359 RepID=UPI00295BA201|nr:hypothetical protein [Aurantibacillus circumpalustris]